MNYDGFRKQLIRQLATTAWAALGVTDEDIARHARGLGVAPELLKAAHDIVERERKARGLKPVQGQKKNERTFPQLEIHMPAELFDLWHSWCESQHCTSNALGRGLIHAYLLGTWEPAHLGQHWVYKGKVMTVPRKNYTEAAWPYRERIFVTRGAKAALVFRARRQHTTMTALVRGLMLEVLEGRYRTVIPKDARSMFDDVDRYVRHLNLPGG